MPRAEFRFSHPHRIRWSEADIQGVAFHGHYLNFFDIAMTEYMRTVRFPYPKGLLDQGSDIYARKSTLEFLDEVRYDDEIDVLARVARVGNTSLTFRFEVHRRGEDRPRATGETVYVNVGVASRRPTPLPEGLVAAIREFEGGAEGGESAGGGDSALPH